MNDEFIYKKINENYFLMDLFCKYMDPMLSSLFSFPKMQIKFWKMKQHVNREEDSLFTLLLLVRILSPKSKPRLINNRVMRIGAHAGQFACQGNQYNDQRSNWRIVKIIYMTAADVLHDVTWSNASLIALRFLLFPLEPSISFYLHVRFTRRDVSPHPGSYPPSNFPITPPPVRSLHFLSCQPSSTPPVPRCRERKGRNANEGNLSQPAS